MILCDHNKLLSAVNFTYSGHPELRTPFECSDYISFHNNNTSPLVPFCVQFHVHFRGVTLYIYLFSCQYGQKKRKGSVGRWCVRMRWLDPAKARLPGPLGPGVWRLAPAAST